MWSVKKLWPFNRTVRVTTNFRMITDQGNGFYAWNGKLYESDIVRACIRPKVRAIGKLVGKHIREGRNGASVNPDVYMRMLLEEPNPYMTGQLLQEKLAVQLELNNNAFAYIRRDLNGVPMEIYPIAATGVQAILDDAGELYFRFSLRDGQDVTFRYADVIHLRKDFHNDDLFGESPGEALKNVMNVVGTIDQGIVAAIKNSAVIRWLLKFTTTLRPEDQKKEVKRFVDDYLSTEGDAVGVAATDAKADAKQVEPKDYVPNEKQMSESKNRIYSFFNTNEKIVQSSYNEDEWISYYESVIEPDVVQMSGEFTRKLFNRRERGFGNRIVFESSNLTFASMQTKLGLVQFVDRSIMSPNEVRSILNMPPVDGGDVMVRRLDTQPTRGGETE